MMSPLNKFRKTSLTLHICLQLFIKNNKTAPFSILFQVSINDGWNGIIVCYFCIWLNWSSLLAVGQDLLTPLNFDKLFSSTICGCSKQKVNDFIRRVYYIFHLNIYLKGEHGLTLHTYTDPKIITYVISYI